jgi:hypothetical protein
MTMINIVHQDASMRHQEINNILPAARSIPTLGSWEINVHIGCKYHYFVFIFHFINKKR